MSNQEPPPSNYPEHYLEKPLPSSPESEKVILGAILLDNGIFVDVVDRGLKAEHFYSPLHKRIFRAIEAVSLLPEKTINPISIGEEIKKEGSVESIGGIATITNLTHGLPHFSDVNEYVDTVKSKSRIRGLIKTCNEITSRALAEEEEAEETIQYAESRIFEVAEENSTGGFVEAKTLTQQSIERAKFMRDSDSKITGRTTGFDDIDEKTSGLQDTNLIIVAARPSMGKTALCLGIAQNSAIRDGQHVAVFSLEMSKEELIERMIASEARVDSQQYRLGKLTPPEWARVEEAISTIDMSRIHILDTPAITTTFMRFKLRRLAKDIKPKQLGLVVVDYMQLMTGNLLRNENRQQEITQISRELKGIAKEFKVPVIAVSQLNRGPENRGGASNHRPMMSDLRESGAIEQDADIVAFVYREDYYKSSEDVIDTNQAEVIFAKNRNGPTGTVRLRFDKPSTRFDNLASEF